MKIKIDCIEVSLLRSAAESRFGKSIRTPRDFSALSENIAEMTGEPLSETTLQRIWRYKSGYSTIAYHSLDVLARYVGARDWCDYTEQTDRFTGAESDMSPANSINVPMLSIGTKIKISWRPDRECILKYLGNYRFEAIETKNSKLSPGDRFTCTNLQLGRELRMDNLVKGFDEMTYVAGSRSGLTALQILGD